MMQRKSRLLVIQYLRIILKFLQKFRLVRIMSWELNRVQFENFLAAHHEAFSINICTPNEMTLNRAKSFSTKEPDTLSWILKFPGNAIFWDVGANIGLYSLWAAISRKVRVFSFEPVASNLEMLKQNIWLNQLENLITVIPLPLSNSTGVQKLHLPSFEYGVSQVAFGVNHDFEGKDILSKISLQTIGITWQQACEYFKIPNPTHIKIDVDGIEHLVLEGSNGYIESVQEVLVEVNNNFADQRHRVNTLLSEAGFYLFKEDKSLPDADLAHSETRNQIWLNHRATNG